MKVRSCLQCTIAFSCKISFMSSANTLVELVRKASSINLASSQLSPCFPYLHVLLTIMLIFHSILILRKSWQFSCKSSWITLYFLIYMRIETVAQQNHLLWDFLIFVFFCIKYEAKDTTLAVPTSSLQIWSHHVTKDGVTSKIRNKSQLWWF